MPKKLLFSVRKSDLVRQTFRTSGNGGQKRNKTENGVRYTHPPSGAVGQAVENREQSRNDKLAFERMANSKEFRNWIRIEAARKMGVNIETPEEMWERVNAMVDNDLKDGRILIEEF